MKLLVWIDQLISGADPGGGGAGGPGPPFQKI